MKKISSCLGKTRIMNCGMEATCIAYRGTHDIDVQFEEGTIVEHKSKVSFVRGQIGMKGKKRVIKCQKKENVEKKKQKIF